MLYRLIQCLGWLVGLRFAPDHHVVPIFRLGCYHHARGPGFFWVIPLFEQTGVPLDISIREETFFLEEVVTADNIPFSFSLTIFFAFKPPAWTPKQETVGKLVSLSQTELNRELRTIINSYISDQLRWLASRFKAEDLRSNVARLEIKRDLIHYLHAHLHDWGIILDSDGVQIRRISAPDAFQLPVNMA